MNYGNDFLKARLDAESRRIEAQVKEALVKYWAELAERRKPKPPAPPMTKAEARVLLDQRRAMIQAAAMSLNRTLEFGPGSDRVAELLSQEVQRLMHESPKTLTLDRAITMAVGKVREQVRIGMY